MILTVRRDMARRGGRQHSSEGVQFDLKRYYDVVLSYGAPPVKCAGAVSEQADRVVARQERAWSVRKRGQVLLAESEPARVSLSAQCATDDGFPSMRRFFGSTAPSLAGWPLSERFDRRAQRLFAARIASSLLDCLISARCAGSVNVGATTISSTTSTPMKSSHFRI